MMASKSCSGDSEFVCLQLIWKKVEVFLLGPFPESSLGMRYLSILRDPFSLWTEAEPLMDNTPAKIANFIVKTFVRFGLASLSFFDFEDDLHKEVLEALSVQGISVGFEKNIWLEIVKHSTHIHSKANNFTPLDLAACASAKNGSEDLVSATSLLQNPIRHTMLPDDAVKDDELHNKGSDGADLLVESCHNKVEVSIQQIFKDWVSAHSSDWDILLESHLLKLRTEIKRDNGYSSFYAMFGRSFSSDELPSAFLSESSANLARVIKQEHNLESSIIQGPKMTAVAAVSATSRRQLRRKKKTKLSDIGDIKEKKDSDYPKKKPSINTTSASYVQSPSTELAAIDGCRYKLRTVLKPKGHSRLVERIMNMSCAKRSFPEGKIIDSLMMKQSNKSRTRGKRYRPATRRPKQYSSVKSTVCKELYVRLSPLRMVLSASEGFSDSESESPVVESVAQESPETSVTVTQAFASLTDTQASSIVMDTQALSCITDMQALSRVTDTQALFSITDTQVLSSAPDTQALTSITDGQASSSITDGQASSSVTDTQASSSVMDTQASSSVMDTQASSSVMDTQASSSVTDTQASSSVTDTQASSNTDAHSSSSNTDAHASSSITDAQAASSIADTQTLASIKYAETLSSTTDIKTLPSITDAQNKNEIRLPIRDMSQPPQELHLTIVAERDTELSAEKESKESAHPPHGQSHHIESVMINQIPRKRRKMAAVLPIKCPKCPATYLASESDLDFHLQCHQEGFRELRCPFCTKVTGSWAHIQRHLPRHSEAPANLCVIVAKDKRTCFECNKVFATREGMLRHVQVLHNGETRFHCDLCDSSFKERKTYKRHLDIHANITYNCDKCKYKTKIRRNLFEHQRIHEGLGFSCMLCYKVFTKKSVLRSHMETHNTQRQSLVCDQCGIQLSGLATLRQHVRNKHSEPERWPCDQCPYVGRNKQNLQSHMDRAHNKPFRCMQCDYACKSESALGKHVDIFHNEAGRRHPCPMCPYRARDPKQLSEHMRFRHNPQAQKFPCQYCSQQFKTMTMLRHHLPSHTGQHMYGCMLCGYSAKYRQTLHHHVQAKHPGVKVSTVMKNMAPTVPAGKEGDCKYLTSDADETLVKDDTSKDAANMISAIVVVDQQDESLQTNLVEPLASEETILPDNSAESVVVIATPDAAEETTIDESSSATIIHTGALVGDGLVLTSSGEMVTMDEHSILVDADLLTQSAGSITLPNFRVQIVRPYSGTKGEVSMHIIPSSEVSEVSEVSETAEATFCDAGGTVAKNDVELLLLSIDSNHIA